MCKTCEAEKSSVLFDEQCGSDHFCHFAVPGFQTLGTGFILFRNTAVPETGGSEKDLVPCSFVVAHADCLMVCDGILEAGASGGGCENFCFGDITSFFRDTVRFVGDIAYCVSHIEKFVSYYARFVRYIKSFVSYIARFVHNIGNFVRHFPNFVGNMGNFVKRGGFFVGDVALCGKKGRSTGLTPVTGEGSGGFFLLAGAFGEL